MKSYAMSIMTIIGLLLSCEKDEKNSILEMELKSDVSLQISNPNFTITPYGYDPNFTDVPASKIVEQNFTSDKLPATIALQIPENPAGKIEHINGAEYARYYIGIKWDSDGNGKICQGDISLDYNKDNFNIKLDEKQVVYLASISATTSCN